ncbi:MAG: hypothetical protein K0S51_1229 [Bacillales bacterium]|jgi:hypothetical protein|nr:hypothetical protein [Bacillales bacterium]
MRKILAGIILGLILFLGIVYAFSVDNIGFEESVGGLPPVQIDVEEKPPTEIMGFDVSDGKQYQASINELKQFAPIHIKKVTIRFSEVIENKNSIERMSEEDKKKYASDLYNYILESKTDFNKVVVPESSKNKHYHQAVSKMYEDAEEFVSFLINDGQFQLQIAEDVIEHGRQAIIWVNKLEHTLPE